MPLPVVQSSIPLDKIKTDGRENGASVSSKLNKAFVKIDNALFRDASMELRAGYTPAADQDISTKVYTDTKFPKDGTEDMDAGYTPTNDQSVTTKKYVQDELTKENPTRNPFSVVTQLSDIGLTDADFTGDEFQGINLIAKAMPDSSLFLVPGDIVTTNYNAMLPDDSDTVLRIFKHSNADLTVEAFTRKGDRPIQWMGSYDGVQGHERWSGWKRVSQADSISMIVYTKFSEIGIIPSDIFDEAIGIFKVFGKMDTGTIALLKSDEFPEAEKMSPTPGVPGMFEFVKGSTADDTHRVTFYPTDGVSKSLWIGSFGLTAWSGWTDATVIDTTEFMNFKGIIIDVHDIKETGMYYSTVLQNGPGDPGEYSIENIKMPTGEMFMRATNRQGQTAYAEVDINGNINWFGRLLESSGDTKMEVGYVPVKPQQVATKNYVDIRAAVKGAVKVFEVVDKTEMMGYISVGEASTFVMDSGEVWIRNSGSSGTIADFTQLSQNGKGYFVNTVSEMYALNAPLYSLIIVNSTHNTYIKKSDGSPDTAGDFYVIRTHTEPINVNTVNEMISLQNAIPGKIVTVNEVSASFVLTTAGAPHNIDSWLQLQSPKPVPFEVNDFSVVKQMNKDTGTIFVLIHERETIIRKTKTDGSRTDYVTLTTHGTPLSEHYQERVTTDGTPAPQGGQFLKLFAIPNAVPLLGGHKYIISVVLPGIVTKRKKMYGIMGRLKGSTTWVEFHHQEVQGPFAQTQDLMRMPVHLQSIYSASTTAEVEFAIGIKEDGAGAAVTPSYGIGEVTININEIVV